MTTLYLHNVMAIGRGAARAAGDADGDDHQGLLSQNLPWGLVLVGVFITVTLELCGIHSLSFAVGSYLPIATTAPIFAGGLVRAYVEKRTGRREESEGGRRHVVQFGADRRRLACGHLVCGALRF
jgi:hypothetical protein